MKGMVPQTWLSCQSCRSLIANIRAASRAVTRMAVVGMGLATGYLHGLVRAGLFSGNGTGRRAEVRTPLIAVAVALRRVCQLAAHSTAPGK